jgi:hypothetical protein
MTKPKKCVILAEGLIIKVVSFPRKRESTTTAALGIPVYKGMTKKQMDTRFHGYDSY